MSLETSLSVRHAAVYCVTMLAAVLASPAVATPPGFVVTQYPIGAPPAALAFDPTGRLFVLEATVFNENTTRLHVLDDHGVIQSTASVTGDDANNFFIGGMTYDPITSRVLVTDNAGAGVVYSFDATGDKQIVAANVPNVAGVAVRSTGEIFVSTAESSGGRVLAIDRASGNFTPVLTGLAYGGGLAFDPAGDLVVQDVAYDETFTAHGSLRRLPITSTAQGLQFGQPQGIASDLASSYGVIATASDEFFATGSGGLFQVAGSPAAEANFTTNGNPAKFSSAIAFAPGATAFGSFAGGSGGRIALTFEAGFVNVVDDFVTVICPAEPTDFNSDGLTDGADLAIWGSGFAAPAPLRQHGDATADGRVDGADFLAWQAAASGVQSVAIAQLAGAPIPEPAALILAAICLAKCLASVRHRVE